MPHQTIAIAPIKLARSMNVFLEKEGADEETEMKGRSDSMVKSNNVSNTCSGIYFLTQLTTKCSEEAFYQLTERQNCDSLDGLYSIGRKILLEQTQFVAGLLTAKDVRLVNYSYNYSLGSAEFFLHTLFVRPRQV